MLSFFITYKNGEKSVLKDILTVTMNSEIGVPADDMTVTIPYNRHLSENADKITALSNDSVVFTGQVDEIINIKSGDGVITKLTARSPAAALLDNEAEPLTYINPAADFIYHRHLKPFGITEYYANPTPFHGTFKIDKGMSQWQVFSNFCVNNFGSEPRITGDGKAYFSEKYPDKKVVFGKDKLEYYSMKECIRKCKLVSEVKLKLGHFGNYSGCLKNKNPHCEGVNRVRYVNAVSDKTTIGTADKIISNSNSDSYMILLECHGCHIDLIGKSAEINDEIFGRIENLRVNKIRYNLSRSGEITTITLGKENF